MTRWHGTTIDRGFLLFAAPTARLADGRPIEAASWPYVQVSPNGIFLSALQTICWKFVPTGCSASANVRRSPAKNSASWSAASASTRVGCAASGAAGSGWSGR